MGKVVIEYYECDVCKKRSDHSSDLTPLQIAARKYDADGEKYTQVFNEACICVSCREKLWALMDKDFATVEIGGGKTEYFLHDGKENDDA